MSNSEPRFSVFSLWSHIAEAQFINHVARRKWYDSTAN